MKRLKVDKKTFRCMFLGYAHEVKGYRVWNFDSEKVEITRSVTFQELPKTKYVKVICDIPVNARTYHEDDDDEAVEELPFASNQSEAEPMEVDDASTGQIISPPNEFEFFCGLIGHLNKILNFPCMPAVIRTY